LKRRFFGTDGIRGRVGEYPITPDFILKLGWAAGRVLAGEGAHNSVLVGKDTRISGYMFESALEAGLSAAGINTQLLGPMPTPAVAYLTRTLRAQAGIIISASHNPHYDNGIKFFSREGSKLPDDLELKIEQYIDQPMTTVESERIGKASRINDAAGRYIEFCKSTVASGIDLSGMKIVIDCAHGATYHIAPHVFEELGARVNCIGIQPNGLNINKGVGATAPALLVETVLSTGADCGIALDGDGDRVVMVDHTGAVVDGDELLFIIARSRLSEGIVLGPIVGTQMTNLGMEHALGSLGLKLERARVGDRYVVEMMLAHGSLLGGEGSGHIICRDRTTTGDGIVGALQVIAEMAQTGKSLYELKQGMEKYPQILLNVKINGRVDIDRIEAVNAVKAEVERELNGSGRVLLRSSGTEPLIRVMVEARNADVAHVMAHRIAETVSNSVTQVQAIC
jgi:phosphoglucosamine mutase